MDAQWLDAPKPRYNVGISFDCPIHGTHRLTIRFRDPYDGFETVDGIGILALVAENGSLGDLTLTNLGGGDELDFPICGHLRVIQGHVELVR